MKPLFKSNIWSLINCILAAFVLVVGARQLHETTQFQKWLRKEQSRSPHLVLAMNDIDTIPPNILGLHFSIANTGDAVARDVQARLLIDTLLLPNHTITDPDFHVFLRIERRWKIFKLAIYGFQEILYTQATSRYGYRLKLPVIIRLSVPKGIEKEIWLAYHIDSDKAHFYDSLLVQNPFAKNTQ